MQQIVPWLLPHYAEKKNNNVLSLQESASYPTPGWEQSSRKLLPFFFCCVSNNRLGTSALFLHSGCKAGATLELELVHVAVVMKQLVRGFFQDTLEYKTINQVTDRVVNELTEADCADRYNIGKGVHQIPATVISVLWEMMQNVSTPDL